jgi:hypothetical protein
MDWWQCAAVKGKTKIDIRKTECNERHEIQGIPEKQVIRRKISDLRAIYEFMKGYKPRTITVKDENGDLLADSHNILNRQN